MPLPPLRPALLSCSPSLSSPSLLCLFHPTPRAPIATTTFSSPSPPRFFHGTAGDVDGGRRSPAKRRKARRWGALDRESEFEIDRDKAREALEKLDQQLRVLSEKETARPKRRPLPPSSSSSYATPPGESEPDKNRMIGMRVEEPEFSGSYLAYSAVALLILTIINNILFNVFIKPSVDGEEPAPTIVTKSSGNVTAQQAPSLLQQ